MPAIPVHIEYYPGYGINTTGKVLHLKKDIKETVTVRWIRPAFCMPFQISIERLRNRRYLRFLRRYQYRGVILIGDNIIIVIGTVRLGIERVEVNPRLLGYGIVFNGDDITRRQCPNVSQVPNEFRPAAKYATSL